MQSWWRRWLPTSALFASGDHSEPAQARSHPFWRRLLGSRGERAAARYLKRKGYTVLARNLRTRLGELDLIALDARTIVFVEVKTLTDVSAGLPPHQTTVGGRPRHQTTPIERTPAAGPPDPTEHVTPAKQQKLTRLALYFLKRHRLLDHPARFDILALTYHPHQKHPTITHIQNAFPATGRFQFYS